MGKFNVGDKVIILDGACIDGYSGGWTDVMAEHIGEICTISKDIEYSTSYRLSELDFNWDERGLKLCENLTFRSIKDDKISCVIHTQTKQQASDLVNFFKTEEGFVDDQRYAIDYWDVYKEDSCYTIRQGKLSTYSCKERCLRTKQTILEFDDIGGSTMSTFCKFRFSTSEGNRYDSIGKHKGFVIPTVTTTAYDDVFGNSGSATCDKVDYDERQGILEAVANMVYGNFDREYGKFKSKQKQIEQALCKCSKCGKSFVAKEDARACEAAHVERKKARRQNYLLRKRAKEIAFEEAAQKMAREFM